MVMARTTARVGSGQSLGRGNTAINVLGAKRLERRVANIGRIQNQFAPVLRDAIKAMVREVLRTTPVVSGRLYRSFRIQVQRNTITMQFRTPYAFRVNATSRRNMRYVERGLARGIRRANAVKRTVGDGSVVQFRFRRLGVMRYGYGRIEATISYTGVGNIQRGR